MFPMTPTDKIRTICVEMADEQVRQYRDESQNVADKVDSVLAIIALMLCDISEAGLREYLTLGGVDLTSYSNFEIARDFVSWFVSAGTLDITDLFSFSLVDLDTPLVQRSKWDEAMQSRMDKVKVDGIFFRDMVAPYVED